MWTWRQRSVWCLYELRNAKDGSKPPETKQESWNRFLPHSPQKEPTPPTHDLWLLVSRTVRQETFDVWATQFVVPCNSRLRNITQAVNKENLEAILMEFILSWEREIMKQIQKCMPHTVRARAQGFMGIHRGGPNLIQVDRENNLEEVS